MAQKKSKLKVFVVGFLTGFLLAGLVGIPLVRHSKGLKHKLGRLVEKMGELKLPKLPQKRTQVTEDFAKPLTAEPAKTFGSKNQLAFELYRGGTFLIDGKSGYAWQRSDNYGDVAIIRSSRALPETYKVSVEAGEVDYDLEKLDGLANDPQYSEGPLNENGAYLLAITDEEPSGHHTNDWWHQHRKIVIDIDNNVWGHGMPNPIFMVYFDANNRLMAFDGDEKEWQKDWRQAVTYEPDGWYRVGVEKTGSHYILSIYDGEGKLLRQGKVALKDVWHGTGNYPDYLVVGDPHENYYQGSMKVRSISMPVEGK